jgi:PAS domain S-box-containing protein
MSVIDTERRQPSDELTTAESAKPPFDARRNTEKQPWLRLAWLPIPLLLITMIVLGVADLGGSYESPHLLLALNFTFSTLVSLFVAYLIGRSYLVRSTPGLLVLGCAVVFWGAAFVLAAIGPANPNFTATVHNLGVWLSAVCNLTGTALLLRSKRNMPAAGLWLGWAYTLALGAVGFVALGAHAGWTPVFFVQGQGGTPLRQLVLGSAVIMFALAAILLRVAKRKSASPFERWYPCALGLMAVGLFGVLIQSSLGSWLSWTGRAAQYLGGVYMLIAAIASVRESHGWGVSLEAALRESEDRYRLLAETMLQGVVHQDADGKIIAMNPAAERILGKSRDEFLGSTSVGEAHYTIREDGSPFPGLEHPAMVALRTGQRLHGVVMGVFNPQAGAYRWISVDAVPLFRSGETSPFQVYTVFEDITERKQAEEALRDSSEHRRLVLEAGELGAWDYRLDTGEVIWDERCRDMYGFATGGEIDYERAIEHIHPEDRPAVDAAVKQAIAGIDGGAYHREYRVVWPDGSVHWIASHGRVYFEAEGEKRRAIRFIGANLEITERKRAEGVLRTTLQRFYAILSSMYSAVLLVTDEGRVEFANQAFCACFGLEDTPADLAGLYASDTIEKIKNSYRYPDKALARIQEVVDRGQAVMGEELAMQGGRTLLRDFIPLNVDGKSYGRLWLHTDITERDRAEETLRESQSKTVFATLADFVPQMVWMCTPDGLNIYFNQRWVEYTGLTLEESYGRGWNTPFHPDDKQAAWDAWNHAVQTGEEYRVESRLRAADGRYRWFLMRGAPLRSAAGEIVRWFGTCTDIEELKQVGQALLNAQRQLTETVVNQLPCCVALVRGRDMTLQLVNPGYRAIAFGQEKLGKSLPEVWPDIPGFEEVCRRVLETGAPGDVVDAPWRVNRSNGGPPEVVYFSWSIHRVNLPGGEGCGLLITGWETTGRKQAEEALLRSEKLAAVGRMAASIAHEINNPLAAVTNTLYLARTNAEDAASVRQYLDLADDELKRVSHITRQTLGFYRESSASTAVSVSSVMDAAVDLLRGKIKVKRATIEKQYDGDLQVSGISGELRQVFSNLLVNSLDAIGEEGTIWLRISKSTCVNGCQSRVRVTVADNGTGIDAAALPRIFEPLFTTKESTGSGLGLWVSKQLIEKHGGSIRVRSRTNGERRGTVFSIVLPIDPAAAARSQSAGA